MRIGMKLDDLSFVIIECPDEVTFVPSGVGAPDIVLPGGEMKPIETLYRLARKKRKGYRFVEDPNFSGQTNVIQGMLGYHTCVGRPEE